MDLGVLGSERLCSQPQVHALAQAPGRTRRTSAPSWPCDWDDRKELGVRLLIGCVSVVSDWCFLGLCDTACLCTAITIPKF